MPNVACPGCGELLPANDEGTLILAGSAYVPEHVAQELERDLRKMRSRVTRLTRDLAAERKSDPLYAAAERIFHHWVKAAGKNPERVTFTEDREKAVLARLKEAKSDRAASTDAIKARERLIIAAIEYVCANPYQLFSRHVASPTGNATKRTELAYVCARGSRVEEWAELWEREAA